jgi:hypothetical protein
MISSYFNAFQEGQLEPSSTHFWLLGGAIIGSLIVAAGIMLEANWPLSRMKFRGMVGVTFVLFGVCVEALFTIAIFVFDEGISRSQQTTISKQQETIIGLGVAQQSLTEEENKTRLAASVANERAARLTAENLAFEKILEPRRISFDTRRENFVNIANLDNFKGTPVFIQAVPDFEAKVLASDIRWILLGHQWVVEYVDEYKTHWPPQAIEDGVSIVTHAPTLRPSLSNAGWNAGKAVADLLNGSSIHVWDILHRVGLGFAGVPDNAVVIDVGMKPVAQTLGKTSGRMINIDAVLPP